MDHSKRSMATCAGLLLIVGLAGGARAADATWFLSGTKIYTAPDAEPIDDGVVVVRAGSIAAVGSKEHVEVPAGARKSACSGGVVAAGFQNSHVHLTGPQFLDAADTPAAALGQALTRMFTRYGFSTIVDVASDRDNTLALRSRIDSSDVAGPRILTVGAPLFPVDGIPSYLAEYPKALLERMAQPATPESAVEVVRENLDAGADGTKLFVATPQADRTLKRIPVPIARAAVAETQQRGKLAMAHPTDIEGIETALAAGVDILVHTTLGVDTAWPEPLVQRLVERNVSVVPTLKLWHYELDKDHTPAPVQQRLVAATFDQLMGFVAAGGQILFGTDVGYMTDVDPTEEYTLMAEAGLTPMQILASLTTAPAARWKESERRGRLDVGMDADIVVLDGDPAIDVASFGEVRCTFRDGARIYMDPD